MITETTQSTRTTRSAQSHAVLLLGHGSRDPRAAYVVGGLLQAVAAATGMTVRAAYLDFAAPTATYALRALADDGFSSVRVVPLLFTPGYHLTHDVPLVLVASGVRERMQVSVAPALLATGGSRRELLLTALAGRLIQAGSDGDVDGLVLASAGSSSPGARLSVESLAGDLARLHGIPVELAFASGNSRTPTQALEALAGRGVQRPAVASLFVAPGRLTDAVAAACPDVPVADPLGVSPTFVELLVAQTRALAGRQ
jgi:sirohydrochlorin ferrochelatase